MPESDTGLYTDEFRFYVSHVDDMQTIVSLYCNMFSGLGIMVWTALKINVYSLFLNEILNGNYTARIFYSLC